MKIWFPVSLWQSEWRLLQRDRVYWGALLGWILLLAWGVRNGVDHLRWQERAVPLAAAQLEKDKRENREFFTFVESQPGAGVLPWNPGILAFQLWPTQFLPPSALAVSAVGQSDVRPLGVRPRSQFDWALTGEEIENPLNLLTGRFDLAFVIVFLLPLLL